VQVLDHSNTAFNTSLAVNVLTVMNAKGGCEHDIKNRIKAALQDAQNAKSSKEKAIQDNVKTGDDVRSKVLGSDEERGRAAGEDRNENYAKDT